ncbi:hypothetical protein GN244_ATG20938 [Phytophthora infestans]|uniref:Uncharacterized protein n=1 Tax=Phytophthora infestans TaxID=4787 RepID=A0A833SNC9_PHYIN|nr:hypothetical protein GN244_ATG20938 [Phytophthora infestans]
MHRCTNQVNREVRAGARMSHNKKLGTAVAQFDTGDYVLYADVWQHTRSQLRVNWCRPAQVTGTVSNWIFVIENLITGQGREAHASRLKVYADSSLNVSDDVLKHAAHSSQGHVVDKVLNARYNSEAKRHGIDVRRRGLSNKEDSLRSSRHAATRRSSGCASLCQE